MGKRNSTVVVLSSDDEDTDCPFRAGDNRRVTRSRLSSTAPPKKPGRAKKARLSDSGPRFGLGSVSTDWDEVKLAFGDFDQGVSGFKVPAGSGRSSVKELWVDKYKPRSLEELAVQKKKVQEVKGWFEERLTSLKVCTPSL